jgi:hypothetical protein
LRPTEQASCLFYVKGRTIAMTRKSTLLVAAIAGLALLAIGVTWAQRPAFLPPPAASGPQTGRFQVAHVTATRIIILDTMTGQLYQATDDDIKKYAELPRIELPPAPPPFAEKDKDNKEKRFEEFKKDK